MISRSRRKATRVELQPETRFDRNAAGRANPSGRAHRLSAGRMPRPFIQRAKRLQDLIDRDRRLEHFRRSQRRT
jgi:hypothetical protein